MRVVEAIKFDGSSRLQPKPGRRLGAVNILPERSPSESVIFVHLGTLDLPKTMTSPVDITPYRKSTLPLQVHDTSLELSISLAGSNQNETVPFPFVVENSDRPWCFTSDDPLNAAIVLKVSNSIDRAFIGTGVALIDSLFMFMGSKRDTLIDDYKIPLISDDFGHVGCVIITVVSARPYSGTRPPPRTSQTLTIKSHRVSAAIAVRSQTYDEKRLC